MLLGVAASPVDLLRHPPLTPLAERRCTLAVLVCEERTDKQIDGWSGVPEHSVSDLREQLFTKIGVRALGQFVRIAIGPYRKQF